jgi:hypothetical protein
LLQSPQSRLMMQQQKKNYFFVFGNDIFVMMN